ncbi:hypothetical protein [endosymbiont GvMRE of Glomus versiforme]|uniref:hypothetical protein n=1 Tax=endosymbiont GvMRE of Glomus versiforme TaxID=2039283 RepID=UPI000ECA0C3B|nr:hypothetical protein [endosymbiont GvMRE of Glomus versiforme]RHZ35254.1 hypothetical protein GvMRE_IIg78 [endosymbiont GvMRE of Glomus versiforme]
MKTKRLLFWIIAAIIFFVGGSFFVLWGAAFWTETSNSRKNGFKNENGKITNEQIEEYLLEKRLELKKYFAFNLQQEVKTLSECEINSFNSRACSSLLIDHLSKIAKDRKATCKKKFITFLEKKFEASEEWIGEKLDEKIRSGNYWIIFEKNKDNDYRYFGNNNIKPNVNNIEFNSIFIVLSEPDVKIGRKAEILEIIKTDPSLANRV